MLCVILVSGFVLQTAAPAVRAETAQEESLEPKKGTFSDNGITMDEFTADCYLQKGAQAMIDIVKEIENWPSEKLLASAEENGLKTTIKANDIVHLPTDPTLWMDEDIKKKDYYFTILISLFLDESQMYNDSSYEAYTKYISSDSKVLKGIEKWLDVDEEIGSLNTQEKADLKKSMQEYLEDEDDVNIPALDVVECLMKLEGTVEDAVKLLVEFTGLYHVSEKYKALVDELKKETEDDILLMALGEVSEAMESMPSAILTALSDVAVDAAVSGTKKLVNKAYKEVVLDVLPIEIRLGLQIGTLAGDTVISVLFSNGDTKKNLVKLECIGTLGRTLISASDRFKLQYQNDKKSSALSVEQRQSDAALYVRSVDVLLDLRKLSCDYSETFADNAYDGTEFEKILRIINSEKDDDYKKFLEDLATDKQTVLKLEEQLMLNTLLLIQDDYPDEYAVRIMEDMSMDDYIDKLLDDYKEEIDAVPQDYAPEGTVAAKKTVSIKKVDTEKLLDDFVYNELPAYDGLGDEFYLRDLQDKKKGPVYAVGPRLDLDNDGENELILIGGSYGGMILDVWNGKITVLDEGKGENDILGYGYYEDSWVVCHKDMSQPGKDIYIFYLYKDADKVSRKFRLTAEYGNQDGYNESSTFTFKGKSITMQEYENLLREIFAKGDPSFAEYHRASAGTSKTDTQKEAKTTVSDTEPAENAALSEGDCADAEKMIQGLWITSSSSRGLYYFDKGAVTFYSDDNYPASKSDRNYTKETTRSYTIEALRPDEGSGFRIILDNGNEYWLTDEFPNSLSCYFYYEGELHYSGSGSLLRVTDFTIDDLIVSSP